MRNIGIFLTICTFIFVACRKSTSFDSSSSTTVGIQPITDTATLTWPYTPAAVSGTVPYLFYVALPGDPGEWHAERNLQ